MIRNPESSVDVIFQARDFLGSLQDRPYAGLEVTFEQIPGDGKGPRGVSVKSLGVESLAGDAKRGHATQPQPMDAEAGTVFSNGSPFALVLMLACTALVAWAAWGHQLPWWALGACVLLNLFIFLAWRRNRRLAG